MPVPAKKEENMLTLLFTRPITTLLTITGVALLAPVIFPIVEVILRPAVKPITNLYLDLADEVADALTEREERKGFIKPEGAGEELKKLVEEVAEDKTKLARDASAAERLVGKI